MPDIYDRGRALAARMLKPRSQGEKGLEITLTQNEYGEYDPATGGQAIVKTDTVDGSGFRKDYKIDDIDGTYILAGDFQLLVSPVTLSGADMPMPKNPDVITFDGMDYVVVRTLPMNYAGLVCGYKVQVRNG